LHDVEKLEEEPDLLTLNNCTITYIIFSIEIVQRVELYILSTPETVEWGQGVEDAQV
jgi:hypothetical protein